MQDVHACLLPEITIATTISTRSNYGIKMYWYLPLFLHPVTQAMAKYLQRAKNLNWWGQFSNAGNAHDAGDHESENFVGLMGAAADVAPYACAAAVCRLEGTESEHEDEKMPAFLTIKQLLGHLAKRHSKEVTGLFELLDREGVAGVGDYCSL